MLQQIQPLGHHLAQINVGKARFSMDDPRMRGFTSPIATINAIADRAPGFVWRLQSESGNALDIILTDDPLFNVNMSVWETPEALMNYVWKTAHAKVYAGKAQWFVHNPEPIVALWWVPVGHRPCPEEGLARLDNLRKHGPSDRAFGWESLALDDQIKAARCG